MRSVLLAALAVLVAQASAVTPAVAQQKRGAAAAAFADFSVRFVNVQHQAGGNLIAQTLESGLRRSRNAARVNSHPLPDEIRAGLAGYFPDELLDQVRYSIGDTTPDGLAGFAMRNGNAAAVTLIDTVVFKNERYVNNLALWAHEMHHVHQYADWGVAGFASRYAFGWEAVEKEARERAQDFVNWYKARAAQH